MEKGKYKNLCLALTDDSDVVVQKLIDFQNYVKDHSKEFNVC